MLVISVTFVGNVSQLNHFDHQLVPYTKTKIYYCLLFFCNNFKFNLSQFWLNEHWKFRDDKFWQNLSPPTFNCHISQNCEVWNLKFQHKKWPARPQLCFGMHYKLVSNMVQPWHNILYVLRILKLEVTIYTYFGGIIAYLKKL